MPLATVPRRFPELPQQRQVLVVCHLGRRSLQAARFLRRRGVDAVSVLGGTDAWERSGRPLDC